MRRSVVVFVAVLSLAMSSMLAGAAANAANDPWQAVKAATARYHSFKPVQKAGYTAAGEPCVASPLGTMGITPLIRRLWRTR